MKAAGGWGSGFLAYESCSVEAEVGASLRDPAGVEDPGHSCPAQCELTVE